MPDPDETNALACSGKTENTSARPRPTLRLRLKPASAPASPAPEAIHKADPPEPDPVLQQNDDAAQRERNRALKREIRRQRLAEWQERWPQAFNPANRRPLKIGTFKKIAAACPELHQAIIGDMLERWTRDTRYLRAMVAHGSRRVALDGSDAGEVSDEHRAQARADLLVKIAKFQKSDLRRAEQEMWALAVSDAAAKVAAMTYDERLQHTLNEPLLSPEDLAAVARGWK